MKRRIGLARTLILKPEVVLYDEPITGLDPITGKEMRGADPVKAAARLQHIVHHHLARPQLAKLAANESSCCTKAATM
ncbi:MAG: hypothetical protein IPF41_05395 [Flavobacteriales bacterium]|nr:hypothetical protein [Flavobacteriales bacterium]